jgi:hypothetical protein
LFTATGSTLDAVNTNQLPSTAEEASEHWFQQQKRADITQLQTIQPLFVKSILKFH